MNRFNLIAVPFLALTLGIAACGAPAENYHTSSTTYEHDQQVATVCLDGRQIQSTHDFHVQLAAKAHFPSYYGNNLDALYDVLSTWSEPLHVFWYDYETSRVALNRDDNHFDKIVKVFEDARRAHAPVALTLIADARMPATCGE